jgi:hypothetical protein
MTRAHLLDPEFSIAFVDFVSDLSNLSISLYLDSTDTIDSSPQLLDEDPIDPEQKVLLSSHYFYMSEKNLPEFCKAIRSEFPGVCDVLIPPGKKTLFRCSLGLWCRIIPLGLKDGSIAYFNVGHRRLENKMMNPGIKLMNSLKDMVYQETYHIDWKDYLTRSLSLMKVSFIRKFSINCQY